MKQFWNLIVVFSLFIQCSTAPSVTLSNKRPCAIDAYNKSNTIHNLRKNCNTKQLQRIFTNLKAGTFPPNGKLKGYVLQGEVLEKIWYGKTITYMGGKPPNDHGLVINTMYNKIDFFKASIYRTKAPIDGKEAFAIDYKNDLLAYVIIDYIRKVQNNLYLGIATLRPFRRYPILFFLLEKK